MAATFRGTFEQKLDLKGRVSIPARFRPVIEDGDPDWPAAKAPSFILVYGGATRNFLEGFPISAMAEVDEKIKAMPRGSAKRAAAELLFSGQTLELTVDETGRIVLPKAQRDKIGLTDTAFFIATGDTFRIWKPETFEAEMATRARAEGLDPDVDASVYLDEF